MGKGFLTGLAICFCLGLAAIAQPTAGNRAKKIVTTLLGLLGIAILWCFLAVVFPPVSASRLHALARQIANSDRIVLTTFYSPQKAEFLGIQAQKLVLAVSHSKNIPTSKNAEYNCVGGTFMWFYSGTNLLAQVPGHGDHFHIAESFYRDESGALHAAWEVIYNQQ